MKKRILFIIPLPPPIHGSSVVSQCIKDSPMVNESFDCDFVNLSTSRRMDEIGKLNPVKLFRFVSVFFSTFWKLLTHRYNLCYLAITCHGGGFLKDAPFVLLCKLFRRKIIIHQHNKGMARDVDRWPYRWLLPLVYHSTRVILLSERLYPDIDKIVPRESVVICPNGIPTVSYEYKKRNNITPRLLFLSNLIESKGVIVLLDALELLNDKKHPFVCDFVGDATQEISTERFALEVKKRRLEEVVKYHGRKTGAEKESYLTQSDIFVFPSFYENECLPLVLMEAMQCGLPIITTDEGGIPDIVEDGVNGLICEKQSATSLADALERLLEHEDLRIQMGKNGLNRYMSRFTLDHFEHNLTSILQEP